MEMEPEYLDSDDATIENGENSIFPDDDNAIDASHASEMEEYVMNEQYSCTHVTMQRTTIDTQYQVVQFDVPETAEVNSEAYPDIANADYDFKRSLVLAAIGPLVEANDESHELQLPQQQMPDDIHDHSTTQNCDVPVSHMSPSANIQSDDITTTDEFLLDIQAEIDVETCGRKANNDAESGQCIVGPMLKESEIPVRSKRDRKQKPELTLYLKTLNAKKPPTKAALSDQTAEQPKDKKKNRRQSMNAAGQFANEMIRCKENINQTFFNIYRNGTGRFRHGNETKTVSIT